LAHHTLVPEEEEGEIGEEEEGEEEDGRGGRQRGVDVEEVALVKAAASRRQWTNAIIRAGWAQLPKDQRREEMWRAVGVELSEVPPVHERGVLRRERAEQFRRKTIAAALQGAEEEKVRVRVRTLQQHEVEELVADPGLGDQTSLWLGDGATSRWATSLRDSRPPTHDTKPFRPRRPTRVRESRPSVWAPGAYRPHGGLGFGIGYDDFTFDGRRPRSQSGSQASRSRSQSVDFHGSPAVAEAVGAAARGGGTVEMTADAEGRPVGDEEGRATMGSASESKGEEDEFGTLRHRRIGEQKRRYSTMVQGVLRVEQERREHEEKLPGLRVEVRTRRLTNWGQVLGSPIRESVHGKSAITGAKAAIVVATTATTNTATTVSSTATGPVAAAQQQQRRRPKIPHRVSAPSTRRTSRASSVEPHPLRSGATPSGRSSSAEARRALPPSLSPPRRRAPAPPKRPTPSDDHNWYAY
jgi:hypothetical protein